MAVVITEKEELYKEGKEVALEDLDLFELETFRDFLLKRYNEGYYKKDYQFDFTKSQILDITKRISEKLLYLEGEKGRTRK